MDMDEYTPLRVIPLRHSGKFHSVTKLFKHCYWGFILNEVILGVLETIKPHRYMKQ